MSIILFDLPSRRKLAWSLNPWKVRLLLNFKGLDYSTDWTEYPDIAPKLKAFGIEPNESGPAYTIPATYIPDSPQKYIMGSKAIARELERLHPTPRLQVDHPLADEVENYVSTVLQPQGAPAIISQVPAKLLNPASEAYFQETRAKRFGMPLDELFKQKGEQAWTDVQKNVQWIVEKLREREGPFFLGQDISYADFPVAGWLQMLRTMDETNIFNRVLDFDKTGSLALFYDSMKPYVARNDH